MQTINWGIIGCGDVTEKKSGPAFNKVPNSRLVAVMRRDKHKAQDYARRHNVPKWYDDATALINDEAVNAIYVATPPASHEYYSIQALKAGKPVYVEKPMTLDVESALRVQDVVEKSNAKLVVAHYRREQPLFKKLKELISQKIIGEPQIIQLKFLRKKLNAADIAISKTAWRVDPAIAGGGLFHDLAPHQLDILYFLFGEAKQASGYTSANNKLYHADDMVSGSIQYDSGAVFQGSWCFTLESALEEDNCEIIGTKGKINFGFFDRQDFELSIGDKQLQFAFPSLEHVQQPMIEQVVRYFLDERDNPCSVTDGVRVANMMQAFTKK